MAQISSQMEEVDKVVKSFASKMDEYVKYMKQKSNEIRGGVAALGSSWSGELYDGFKSKMSMQLASLDSATARGEKLKDELDSLSAKLSAALEKMRAAGK